MKIGANSVLFGAFDMETAFKYTAMAGYDGIELSAINGMSEHLVLDRWQELAPEIRRLSQAYGLELLAMEQPSQDPAVMETAFQAAVEIGIPVVNCGPGGKADDEESFRQSVESLGNLSKIAERYGVTLCVKAHVGAAIYNTPTTLRLMEAISSPAFGIDMDPSHIWRAGEDPVEAIAAVISRVKHVHIRDCKGRQHGPGEPNMQANGTGRHQSRGLRARAPRTRLRRACGSGGHRHQGQGLHAGAVLCHRGGDPRPHTGQPPGVRRAVRPGRSRISPDQASQLPKSHATSVVAPAGLRRLVCRRLALPNRHDIIGADRTRGRQARSPRPCVRWC